ncbi:uncharacterized protein [Arachis hypogaea]|uniref:uncharacterized protein n=1 Tax=Arachis hypogaea TaxID=3818 RepID=UPI003B20DC62
MTCNPNWPEFQRYTSIDGIPIADRPDISCRVFHAKLKCLLTDLKDGVFFGPLNAGMYTIEFQKRGLPHAHIVLWLDGRSRLQSTEIIDELICAELPNPTRYPQLYDVYRAHINLEFCNKSNVIKYLFKYVNKGPDRVTATVSNVHVGNQNTRVLDEIKEYFDCRYLSPCESVWRIFAYDIHHRWPSVQRLTFHLPNQQHIIFDDRDTISSILVRNKELVTMFIAWMLANRVYPEGKDLTYVEFPRHFVYIVDNREWKPRQRGFSIDYAGMPLPNVDLISAFSNSMVVREMQYDVSEMLAQHDDYFAQLTAEQESIYHAIISRVLNKEHGFFFVYGFGGTESAAQNSDMDELRLFSEWILQVGEDRAILAATIEIVEEINDHIVNLLPGEMKEYLSSDCICGTDANVDIDLNWINVEFLNQIKCSVLPNHSLKLKVGAPVILLRNIDPAGGLCNGTRLIVHSLGRNVITADIVSGSNVGDRVFISRMNLIPSDSGLPFKFQRRQFPLLLCFAMTINKSQGQTLSTVGLFLRRPVFSHGQLYVAISRVKYKKGLRYSYVMKIDLKTT